jgi:RHS repeat-associated protein
MNNVTYAQNGSALQFGGAAQLITGASFGGGSGTYQYSATFDALLRATDRKITNYNGSTTLFDQARTFDAAGNVLTIGTTLPQGSDNQVFCYDEQDRLTWAGSTGTPPCTGTAISPGSLTAAQYTDWRSYDAMGRLTARPNSFGGGGQDTYVYGDPAHVHAVTTINGQLQANTMPAYSAIYDAAGNMTCRDTGGGRSGAGKCIGGSNGAQLTYDAEGSLVAWQNAPTNPTTSAGFLYDGHGNRVEQQLTQNGTTTTTIYVGNLEEISTTGSTTTTTNYFYAGSARIAMAVNGVFSYLGTDGQGSTNVALDASGNATASTLYLPYGWVRYSSGTMPTSYGFTGERSDNATQLDYFNARYYDPVAGQFTTADTVLPGGGYDIFGLSRYAYVEGNPTTRTDPSGRCPWCVAALVGGVIGGAVSYGTQVVGNLQHGQSLGSALTHVDVGEIAKSALVGFVIGGTGGLATAGLGAVGLGGLAAGVGGRFVLGGVEGGVAQVGDNLLHGRSWSDGVEGAMVIGAATGGLSPLGGAALRQVAKRFGGGAIRDGGQALKGSICALSFSADTQVATPDGPRAIADIKAGNTVLAYDPDGKQVTAQTVDQVFVNHDSDRLDVTLEATAKTTAKERAARESDSPAETNSTETIHTTSNHPWLTADRGWVDAGALQVGESVQLANGSVAQVDALQSVPGVGTMYDFSLEHVHTFAVGGGLYVVHNCGGPAPSRPGRLGNPDHRAAVEQIRQDILNRGYTPRTEFGFETPNGLFKSRRFADVVAIDSDDNVVEIYQVGRQRANGWIVRREVQALADLASQGASPILEGYGMDVNVEVNYHTLL